MKKIAKTVVTLSLVGCTVITSPFALADDASWYMGGNIGQSKSTIDDGRITSSLLGGSFITTSITDVSRDTGYKIFGGYKFNKNFALEGGYFNLGKFGFTATTLPTGTLSGNIKLDGLNLDVVGILPISENFSVFGRVGMNYAEAKDSFSGTVGVPANPNPSKNEVNPKIGLGLQYDFTESLGMRADAERYHINDAIGNHGDIDLISVGLVYRLGVNKPASEPATKVAAPEPISKAAVPEPVMATIAPEPVVIPPTPTPKKITFSTDSSTGSIFDFGEAAVKPTGQEALNKFVADLRDASFDIITVTGHTDRIGSKTYNMKLSTRRAEAVKAYLVKYSGIPSDKITANGVGGAEPVTKPGECNSKNSKKLIAYLAPDRRVEVEVSAMRISQ